MITFIVRILGNSVALFVAQYFVVGFVVSGGIKEYALAGILLGLLNTIVRPLMKLISLPLMIMTLGLFSIVINSLMIWLVDYIFLFVNISDIKSLIWTTIIVGIVNTIISWLAKLINRN